MRSYLGRQEPDWERPEMRIEFRCDAKPGAVTTALWEG